MQVPFGGPVVPDVYTKTQHWLTAIFFIRSFTSSSLSFLPISRSSFQPIMPSWVGVPVYCTAALTFGRNSLILGNLSNCLTSSATTMSAWQCSATKNLLVIICAIYSISYFRRQTNHHSYSMMLISLNDGLTNDVFTTLRRIGSVNSSRKTSSNYSGQLTDEPFRRIKSKYANTMMASKAQFDEGFGNDFGLIKVLLISPFVPSVVSFHP